MQQKGKVFLVGAGPGKAGLLTMRGREVIDAADVVLYDQLAGEILSTLPSTAELIDCGKFGSRHTLEQAEIEDIMVARAEEGKRVVRLKGGDPFLFGRGGEELEVLRTHCLDVEVVPGVTSAIAVPACVGIPVTHRSHASQVTLVTGHEDPEKSESVIRWDLLGQMGGTLVILMGVKNLPLIVDALLKGGRAPVTPVAIIERGLTKDQRVVTGTLDTIVKTVVHDRVSPPAIIVIGDVVKMYEGENLCGP
ncbi:MAG: uroporphyrinogen-III C-methyltransferase [Methanomicrobiales archaeon]|nr:uroporphyrinogen-III C-methyltransferase [Methanomicrobiales archaeon]